MFSKIKHLDSAVDTCATALRQAIVDGRLEPGDRLPPERRLAELFGVNRLTVRAALSRLSAAGLVSVRQGRGYRVEDYERRGGPQLLGDVLDLALDREAHQQIIGDLLHVRRHLARAALERLSTLPDQSIFSSIDESVDAFADHVARGASTEEIAIADVDVIGALLKATGSPVYSLCLNPIVSVVSRSPSLREVIYRAPEENLMGYRLLQAWLKHPNPTIIESLVDELARRDRETLHHLAHPQERS
jgi:GntR family transcriptional regulator, transcriptional repressor for pyruvate dehydrogenase complex